MLTGLSIPYLETEDGKELIFVYSVDQVGTQTLVQIYSGSTAPPDKLLGTQFLIRFEANRAVASYLVSPLAVTYTVLSTPKSGSTTLS